MTDGDSLPRSFKQGASMIGNAKITIVLAATCVVLFLLMSVMGGRFFSPEAGTLVAWGANVDSLSLGGQPWRLITSIFLHNGLIHALIALSVMIVTGIQFERRAGAVIFFFSFLVLGFSAAICSAFWNNNLISVGSNGATWGMIGALSALFLLGALPKRRMMYVAFAAIPFLIIDLLDLFGIGADLWLDLGGFLSGMLLGGVLRQGIKSPKPVLGAEPEAVVQSAESGIEQEELPIIPLEKESHEIESVAHENEDVSDEAEKDLSLLLTIPPDPVEEKQDANEDQPEDQT